MAYEFYLGIDTMDRDNGHEIAAALIEKRQADGDPEYVIHSLKAFEDADPAEVADWALDEISGRPYAGRTVGVTNVSDRGGVTMRKTLSDRGFSSMTVRLTGGDSSREQGRPLSFGDGGVQVSENEVVGTLDDVQRAGRLDVANVQDDEASSALVQGLEDYHVSRDEEEGADVNRGPQPSRRGTHSPLVLAAASALWLAEQQSFDPTEHLAGDPPPVRRAKQEMRPDTT